MILSRLSLWQFLFSAHPQGFGDWIFYCHLFLWSVPWASPNWAHPDPHLFQVSIECSLIQTRSRLLLLFGAKFHPCQVHTSFQDWLSSHFLELWPLMILSYYRSNHCWLFVPEVYCRNSAEHACIFCGWSKGVQKSLKVRKPRHEATMPANLYLTYTITKWG